MDFHNNSGERGRAVILKRICQLMLTRITHQVSRTFDLHFHTESCSQHFSYATEGGAPNLPLCITFLRYCSLITCNKADICNPLSLLDHACMRIFLFLLAHFHFFFRRMSVHTDHAAFLQRSYKKICKDTSYYCGNKKWHNVYKQTSRI